MPTPTDMSVGRLEDKLKIKPNSLVFSRLADSYRKSGDVQQAISISVHGLESHPDYVTGRIILGRCYLEQENFNDAIKEFTKICQLDRHNQIAIKMLADIFSKQGMEEKAGNLYNLLFKMDPENPSLEHLITVFKGSNKSNLYEILGIDEGVVEITPAAEAEKQASEEVYDESETPEALEEVGVADEGDIGLPQGDEVVAQIDEVIPGASEDQFESAPEAEPEPAAESDVGELAEPADKQLPDDALALEATEQVPSLEDSIAEDTAIPEISEQVEPELPSVEVAEAADQVPSLEDSIAEDTAIPEISEQVEPESPSVEVAEATDQVPSLEDSIAEDVAIPEVTDQVESAAASPEAAEQVPTLEESIADDIAVSEVSDQVELESEPAEDEVVEPEMESALESATEAPLTKEPSLDDILTPDSSETESEPAVEELQVQPEATPTEDLGDVTEMEAVSEDAPKEAAVVDKQEDGVEAEVIAEMEESAPDVVDQLPEAIDKGVPDADDISVRMDAMFGDEEEGEPESVSAVEELSSETGREALTTTDEISRITEIFEEGDESETGEMTSRMEDMFGDAEELVPPTAVETRAPEPVEELLPPGEMVTAPTEILDKKGLDELRKRVTETPAEELVEEEISVPGEDLTITGEEHTQIVEMAEIEREMAAMPTEIIDPMAPKEEVLAETQDLSDISPAAVHEPTEELMPADFTPEEEAPENIVTDATAVYDRKKIKEMAASESEELSETVEIQMSASEPEELIETVDIPMTEIPTPQTSLSGEEVISRLDEMFPTEGEPEPVHAIGAETRDISIDLPTEEEIDTLGVEGVSGTVEIMPQTAEPVDTTGIVPDTTQAETASYDRERIDEVLTSPETDVYMHDSEESWERQQTESFEMDNVETTGPLSGEEVASRIDEMFSGEDESIATIPDEDIDEHEQVGEFYTESGDTASIDEEVSPLDQEAVETGEDMTTPELTLDGDLSDPDEEPALDEAPEVSLLEEGGEPEKLYPDSDSTVSLEEAAVIGLEEEETIEPEESLPSNVSLEDAMSMEAETGIDTLASLPEEETIESEPVGEFYTESGDSASLEGSEAVLDSEIETPVSDSVVQESFADDELTVIEEKISGDEMELESIPDEDVDEDEQTSEFYTESGDAAPFEDTEIELEKEPPDRLEETATYNLPSDEEMTIIEEEITEGEESLTAIPDEDTDESEPVSEFYTESGATAETDETVEDREGLPDLETVIEEEFTEEAVLDSVDEEDFYTISGDDTPIPLTGETSITSIEKEKPEEVVLSGEEASFEKIQSPDAGRLRREVLEQRGKIAEKADAIPDHVLTPTLADIYFQQDQPYLAVQIYKRLLERDPDNDRIERRIAEIEQVMKERESQVERPDSTKKTTRKKPGRKKKTSRKKSKDDSRPLKGVRIKRKVKIRIKKKKSD